ncbi:MAG TPA: potassium transporter Kup [Xanthobacteraceae bacterium]|jgi:KUP system potassium uptake protein|nr:potassium transporter Kup [Xanthobacteraceae bacterium]
MTSQNAHSTALAAEGNVTHPDAGFWKLVIGCIGVVYGDIGTSPLYAVREAVTAAADGGAITRDIVIGVLSLIIWSLLIVVTVKYVFILLRADNKGEGGTLSLMALAQRALGRHSTWILMLGIIGAALFYGDAMITPAISVLSAVEGIKIATPAFDAYILPLTAVILIALFLVQSHGTAAVSAFFGPITVIWFVAIAAVGLGHIAQEPAVLAVFSPYYALMFMMTHGLIGFFTLGAVFLAVTGAEALYADLGHFGKRPIRFAWLFFVFPALVLNYLGQGALLLANPKAIENPFFLLYPSWALVPMVVLATVATVIASQAVITGAYSLTQQAVQLGFFPRLDIRHTSESLAGQIYVPRVNWILLAGVLLLVVLFRSSSALASAYGIAVTGTMIVTTLMAFIVIWKMWGWKFWMALALIVPFALIDLTFLAANLLKVAEGGWVSLFVAGMLLTVMLTWRRGARALFEKTRKLEVPLIDLVKNLEKKQIHRSPGTAIFFTSDPLSAPTALLHSLKHYKVLHEQNVILTLTTDELPRVAPEDRVVVEGLSRTFMRLHLRYGFMETPDVPKALAAAKKLGWEYDVMKTSYFLSRRALKAAEHSGMPRWQDRLFIALTRTANDATAYFKLPSSRVVEIGTQVTI